MLDLIERCCATLAALGYDLDRLAAIENELRAPRRRGLRASDGARTAALAGG